jgi:hypothetical protein
MTQPLQGTSSGANSIARVKYTHDAMIDLIIADPSIKQGALARHFGYTEAWVSRIFASDAFQARLAQRKEELVNPAISASIETRMNGLVIQSMEILAEKLEATRSPDLAAKVFELSTKAAGYGARQNNVAVQNTFVVALPSKAENSEGWADKHRGNLGAGKGVVEAETVEVKD